ALPAQPRAAVLAVVPLVAGGGLRHAPVDAAADDAALREGVGKERVVVGAGGGAVPHRTREVPGLVVVGLVDVAALASRGLGEAGGRARRHGGGALGRAGREDQQPGCGEHTHRSDELHSLGHRTPTACTTGASDAARGTGVQGERAARRQGCAAAGHSRVWWADGAEARVNERPTDVLGHGRRCGPVWLTGPALLPPSGPRAAGI